MGLCPQTPRRLLTMGALPTNPGSWLLTMGALPPRLMLTMGLCPA